MLKSANWIDEMRETMSMFAEQAFFVFLSLLISFQPNNLMLDSHLAKFPLKWLNISININNNSIKALSKSTSSFHPMWAPSRATTEQQGWQLDDLLSFYFYLSPRMKELPDKQSESNVPSRRKMKQKTLEIERCVSFCIQTQRIPSLFLEHIIFERPKDIQTSNGGCCCFREIFLLQLEAFFLEN